VAVGPKDFTKPVTDAEVEKYYAEHAQEFETPKKVRASHVLVRVGETGGSEAEDKAKGKIADVIRRAKSGEDFAKLAREVSEDPATKANGGEIGLVGKGEVVPAFEQALFALKKGEMSPEPVRTPFGFHAIKVFEVQEGGKKPLKDAAPQIRERLQTESADRSARTRADEIRAQLLGAGDFAAEAKKLGLTPHDATIGRKQSAPFAGANAMEEAAFNLTVGGVSAPVKTPAGWVVIKNLESLPAAVPALAEIKDKVEAAVKRQKAETAALARAKQIADDVKNADFATAAKKAGAQSGQTQRFSRTKPAERLPGDAMMAALQAQVGAITEPVKSQQGYYVLKVLERVPPDMSGLPAERERVERDLLARKQTQAWQAWLGAARARAKVDVSTQLPSRRG
jgi:peptidyl-prolyl cis-trans isomerase D